MTADIPKDELVCKCGHHLNDHGQGLRCLLCDCKGYYDSIVYWQCKEREMTTENDDQIKLN